MSLTSTDFTFLIKNNFYKESLTGRQNQIIELD